MKNRPLPAFRRLLPVAPSMDLNEHVVPIHHPARTIGLRGIGITLVAMIIAAMAAVIAQGLLLLIRLITNFSFYGQWSVHPISPALNHLGAWVIVVPAIGGVLVGLMARYGSVGIRGHGIPEAMEQILVNESRIAPRLTFLKPISAAFAIGTGGPFGAEGPIISTGGALGSLIGQWIHTNAEERKTLLAAGAAAGMTATFGSPVSSIFLAIELLLFEFRPKSFVPVALASAVAAAVRMAIVGSRPFFAMPNLLQPSGEALTFYIFMGLPLGLAAVAATQAVYRVEDAFERLPIHWMWWPAIGGLAVGAIGYLSPHTLGVGYDVIGNILTGTLIGRAALALCLFKFLSWSIALGSGTSGGTLAPLFTIGGALGAVLGEAGTHFFPQAGIDPRVAALVGMSSMFAGASHAFLASTIFAFEVTLQPLALLPLLGGCATAYLTASTVMHASIMTAKIERKGLVVPDEYMADLFEGIRVSEAATRRVVTLRGSMTLKEARSWFASGVPGTEHQGYPILNDQRELIGVLTKRDFLNLKHRPNERLAMLIQRPPLVAHDDSTLREAAELMAREGIGRLPVVSHHQPQRLTGILTRSNLLQAERLRVR